MTREEWVALAARLLVIGGAAVSFAWWQGSAAAGVASFLTVWAVVVMREGQITRRRGRWPTPE